MKTKLFIITLFVSITLITGLNPKTATAQILNFTGFENLEDESIFNQVSWYNEGFSAPWTNGFNTGRAHVDDAFAKYGSNSLRIDYPANTYGPSTNGAQAPLKVDYHDELYISYWVRFSENFDWGGTYEGGKLPGIGTGALCSGCQVCTGNNGFTARLMWREEGRAVLYLYHIEEDKLNPPCGSNFQLQINEEDFHFEKGQWYNIIERVKINTDENHDGEVEVWINEMPALSLTDVQFVSNGAEVNTLYFSTFHGGGSEEWAPSVDCNTWFDNIVIALEAEDVFSFTSLNDRSESNGYSVYPNPVNANSLLNIILGEYATASYKSEWLNSSGKTVSTIERNSGTSIMVPDLPAGIYMLKLTFDEEVVLKKVVIE